MKSPIDQITALKGYRDIVAHTITNYENMRDDAFLDGNLIEAYTGIIEILEKLQAEFEAIFKSPEELPEIEKQIAIIAKGKFSDYWDQYQVNGCGDPIDINEVVAWLETEG